MLIKDIEKMEAYTPTEYVNDSEPDLDADNLNKTERQLRDTVAKANEIIDTLKSLISNVSVNSEDTVPSSAVAYKMEQDIEQLNSNIEAIKNGLTAVQFTGDINDLRNQSLNMNTQKVYLISKDTVQNIPDAMIGTGLLTIKNMGLFASIEIVDSNKQQYIWGGWNSELITSSNWK